MEFKNYKEKQAYYRERSKQTKMVWVSAMPLTMQEKSKKVVKGRTYVKPKNKVEAA